MIPISRISIETCVWHIKRYMMQKWGIDAANREIYPLEWYIETERASADFLQKLMYAKPFMVARKLHEGGSHDEAIVRVKKYIGA